MYIIYCLQNDSLKNNILSFGITSSLEDLKELVKDMVPDLELKLKDSGS